MRPAAGRRLAVYGAGWHTSLLAHAQRQRLASEGEAFDLIRKQYQDWLAEEKEIA